VKEVEEEIKVGAKKVAESQQKKKNVDKRKTSNKFNHQTAIYVTLGAAAIAVFAFIILKNKK
jgi:hypothetical protein